VNLRDLVVRGEEYRQKEYSGEKRVGGKRWRILKEE
jgi:hypothetical protein